MQFNDNLYSEHPLKLGVTGLIPNPNDVILDTSNNVKFYANQYNYTFSSSGFTTSEDTDYYLISFNINPDNLNYVVSNFISIELLNRFDNNTGIISDLNNNIYFVPNVITLYLFDNTNNIIATIYLSGYTVFVDEGTDPIINIIFMDSGNDSAVLKILDEVGNNISITLYISKSAYTLNTTNIKEIKVGKSDMKCTLLSQK